jgi:hypothetical protein
MFITEVLENHEIYYKTQNRHGLSIMQSYIANHHGRLFVTVYQLYSHILQIIATDCLAMSINYTVIYYKIQIIAANYFSTFICSAV